MVKGHVKTKFKMTKFKEEPAMSDTTILITVEDLINRAMGAPDANIINFKIVRMILEIMARRLRILQQKIEIQVMDFKEEQTKTKKAFSASESSSIKHERKSSQKHKRKDSEQKAFENKEIFDTEDIQINIQADKKEKTDRKVREKAEKEGYEDEGLLEKEEIKEKGEHEEQKILVEEAQEEMQQEIAETLSEIEQDILEEEVIEKTSKIEKEISKEKIKEIKMQESTEKIAQKEEKLEKAERSLISAFSEKMQEGQNILAKREQEEKKYEMAEKTAEEKQEKAKETRAEIKSKKDRESLEKDEIKQLKKHETIEKMALKEEVVKTAHTREKRVQEEQIILEKKEQEEIKYEMAEKVTQEKVKQGTKGEEKPIQEKDYLKEEKIEIIKEQKKIPKKEKILEKTTLEKHSKEEEQILVKMEEVQVEPEIKQYEKRQEKEHFIPVSAKENLVAKKTSDGSRMEITEKQIDNEKILVVEKGPSTRSDTESPSSIDYVTPSQLELLEEAIEVLRTLMPPKPFQMPGNEKLISDIMKGTVSLPEAMETLQVEEKMKSAEASMANIVEMLTQIASAGALPEQIAEQVENIIPPSYKEADQSPPVVEKKSVAIDSKAAESQPTQSQATQSQATRSQATRSPDSQAFDTPEPSESPAEMPKHSTASRSSMASSTLKVPCVTYKDMRSNLKVLKDDITKILNRMLGKITDMTDTAQHIIKGVADKVGVAQKLDSRITALHSLVVYYDSMFGGIDSVMMTQLQNIEGQISQHREIMKSGLARLAEINNNAEATALMKMLARCEEMETELCHVLHEHKLMMLTQKECRAQSRTLLDCIEMMREEKADRDYVLDGLKAKTDKSQLAGRLKYTDFVTAHADFNCRIDQCHERFSRSVALWAGHIKDLKNEKETKANILDLLLERDAVEQELKVVNNKIRILSEVLGDPEIAVTTRQLAVDAICGSCRESALMEPVDASSGVPPRLPAMRGAPAASTELRIPELVRPGPLENRHDYCNRWCGGSHTLAVDPTKLIQVHVQMQAIPTRKYTGYGEDERLYMFEEELQPCIECNALGEEKIQEAVPDLSSRDAGDTSLSQEPKPSTKCSCPLIK